MRLDVQEMGAVKVGEHYELGLWRFEDTRGISYLDGHAPDYSCVLKEQRLSALTVGALIEVQVWSLSGGLAIASSSASNQNPSAYACRC